MLIPKKVFKHGARRVPNHAAEARGLHLST